MAPAPLLVLCNAALHMSLILCCNFGSDVAGRDVEVVALVRREESKAELEAIKGVKAVLGIATPPHPHNQYACIWQADVGLGRSTSSGCMSCQPGGINQAILDA